MASQTVVVVAMGLVSIAGAVALYQHAALPGPVAATAGLAAYLLLLTGHVLAWRSGGRRSGSETPLAARDRREHELRRAKHDARQGPALAAPGPAKAARDQALPPALPPQSRGEPFGRTMSLGHPGELAPQSSQPSMRANADAARPAPPPLPPLQSLAAAPPPAQSAPVSNAPVSDAPLLDDDSEDYWSFRPAAPARQTLPPFVTGRVPGPPSEPALPGAPHAAAPPPLPGPEPASPREADVEVIQDAIKRLLEEVNATEAEAQNAQRGAARAAQPEAAVDRSIDALRMTAGSMRSALDHREPPAQPAAPKAAAAQQPPPLPPFVRQQQPRPASPSDVLARRMADAIAAGRIDVALEPILGLEDQQTRHYEVSVRLRDADGRPIELTANSPDLRGTGLLPLFDAVRVTRTAAVARRLDERGKGGSVFSTFSGESVADEHFLGELAETLHQRGSLATQLVLSFTQSDVRGFSTPEWDSLADMRALGFRFALSHLTDLDMDFEALAEQGFAFVKLDADVFLSGLPAPSGRLPSSDVCRHLASHGLTLVVDGIASDDQLARVFGFGVLLGQGQLFGGARPVRADVVNTSRTAAA